MCNISRIFSPAQQLSKQELEPVIVAKDTDMQKVMGQREGPSFLDVKLANRNYCSREFNTFSESPMYCNFLRILILYY